MSAKDSDTETGNQSWREDEAEGTTDTSHVVTRIDYGTLGKVSRTPQGGVRVPAYLTREGIFEYLKADGTKRREYRPAAEVFAAESLASLEGAPVTDLHPKGLVTAVNWKAHAIGHVHKSPHQDGNFVAAELWIQDAAVIEAIERGDRREISCGYTASVAEEPGEFEGQRYDAVQRNIRYNHAALGPKNWGRAGRDVALRLDADGAVQTDESAAEGDDGKDETMERITVDGVDYPLGTEAERKAATAAHARWVAKVEAERKALAAASDETRGRLDAQERTVAELQKKLAEAEDPKRLDSAVEARLELVSNARQILGKEVKLDGKTDRQIMEEAIASRGQGVKLDGQSDDYVRGLFSGLVATSAAPLSAARNDGLDSARRVAAQAGKSEPDARYDSEAAHQKFLEASRDAWKKPLTASKDA